MPSIVMCGHVDHGKSTLVGRLLADTGTVAPERIERLRRRCESESLGFEFAYLIDSFREERSQGITIEAARVFLTIGQQPFVLIDAPGHAEFVRNMVTGAARADAAIMVFDAKEGICESSKRHAALLSVMGVDRVGAVINKMDLIAFDPQAFQKLADEATALFRGLGIALSPPIPACGFGGENVTRRSSAMPWFAGPTVLELIEQLGSSLESSTGSEKGSFRMPVQDVYRFARPGAANGERIIAGSVASGSAAVGDELVFLPSGSRARIEQIKSSELSSGRAGGLILDRELFISRGEIASKTGEPGPSPGCVDRLPARVFWLGSKALSGGRSCVLKLASQKVNCRLESVSRCLDAGTLSQKFPTHPEVANGEIAECVLKLEKPIVVDSQVDELRRFVLVDGFEIAGGGVLAP